MNPFETETMAELCLRQGHRQEALGIYRRLLARITDEAARARMNGRIVALEATAEVPRDDRRSAADPPLSVPGVRTRTDGNELTLEWRLPPGTRAPVVELLLVKRGPSGVETETRSLAVDGNAGRLVLTVSGLHLARAAAGTQGAAGFVPLARG